MMLQYADQYFVASLKERRPPGLGDKVDCFGGVAHEDDLARVSSIQKTSYFFACFLEKLSRAGAQAIDAAVHVGVVGAVVVGNAVDHCTRFLSAGARIEKHEFRVACKNRKL